MAGDTPRHRATQRRRASPQALDSPLWPVYIPLPGPSSISGTLGCARICEALVTQGKVRLKLRFCYGDAATTVSKNKQINKNQQISNNWQISKSAKITELAKSTKFSKSTKTSRSANVSKSAQISKIAKISKSTNQQKSRIGQNWWSPISHII